jgi:cytochrome c oxidase subunit IV
MNPLVDSYDSSSYISVLLWCFVVVSGGRMIEGFENMWKDVAAVYSICYPTLCLVELV